jgi:hypothetical protein
LCQVLSYSFRAPGVSLRNVLTAEGEKDEGKGFGKEDLR